LIITEACILLAPCSNASRRVPDVDAQRVWHPRNYGTSANDSTWANVSHDDGTIANPAISMKRNRMRLTTLQADREIDAIEMMCALSVEHRHERAEHTVSFYPAIGDAAIRTNIDIRPDRDVRR